MPGRRSASTKTLFLDIHPPIRFTVDELLESWATDSLNAAKGRGPAREVSDKTRDQNLRLAAGIGVKA